MITRLRGYCAGLWSSAQEHEAQYDFSADDLVWAVGSFCALNRKPFKAELLTREFPPPYRADTLPALHTP